MSPRAVITGVGILAARCVSATSGARIGSGPARLPDPLPRPSSWACRSPRLARMDRFSQVTFLAAHDAYARAGLGAARPPAERLGLCLGTAYGCHAVNEDYYLGVVREGPRGASPRLFSATLPSAPEGEMAIAFEARGPALTLAHGWDAGLSAVSQAARICETGRADAVLAGGSDILSDTLVELLGEWGCCPPAMGPVAEAAAFVVVEQERVARERGASALAAIAGWGAAFAPSPSSGGAIGRAIGRALAEAGLGERAVTRRVIAGASVAGFVVAELSREAPPDDDPASRYGVTFGASGVLGVALALEGPPSLPAIVAAADPSGGATAVVLVSP